VGGGGEDEALDELVELALLFIWAQRLQVLEERDLLLLWLSRLCLLACGLRGLRGLWNPAGRRGSPGTASG